MSCTGGNDDEPNPAPDVSGAPTACASSPPSALHNDVDQRRAEAAILTTADVGKGFHGAPQPADPCAEENDAILSKCLNRPPTRTRETARVLSQALTKGDAQRIRAGVTYVTTAREAAADLTALQSDAAPKCLENLMRVDLQREGADVEVRVERLTPPLPGAAAFSLIVVTTAANGQRLPSITDYVAAVKGRGEVDAYFQDVNGHVDQATTARLMNLMLARL
jgi:hypothetical protein